MVKKAEALSHFIGQLILGILQMIAGVGYVLIFQELFGALYSMMGIIYIVVIYSTLAFIVVHGLWRIVDNFVRWRNAD